MMRERWPLLLILACYLLVGILYAAQVPDWQAPDEPAHYNYVRQLASGRLPIITDGDYDQAYLETITDARFAPEYSIVEIEYEDWQPPLYYLLLTPVFLLTNGSLFALRFTSVLLGVGIILLAYQIARLLLPEAKWVAWSTAVFVAFIPQHVAMLASVNNDSLSELLIALLLYLTLRWVTREGIRKLDDDRRWLIGLGVVLGLGFLTKATVYLMAPVLGVVILWQFWGNWQRLFQAGVLLFAPAFMLGAIWWVRNVAVYGGLDVLGTAAHNAVVVGQPRTAEWVNLYGLDGTIQRFFQTTFNSFWGQFGWMAVPMRAEVYWLLLGLCGAAVLGLLLYRFTTNQVPVQFRSKLPVLILWLVFLLTLAIHVGYNVTFVQHQGRYLFPALIPISLGFSLGLGTWLLLVEKPFRRERPLLVNLLPLAIGTAFILLDLFALFRFILPSLRL
ncbi:glycosyltransferase family 39 protein [Candidatus Leptofilum sp.]|uniref:glycosyltransferase family 39 protein n=1 Tax=Candidatus Leptofilum sp. TaxID=3241576 RepID=UPI003B5B5F85